MTQRKVSQKTLEALTELDEFLLQTFHKHKDSMEGFLNDLKEFFKGLDFENKVAIINYVTTTLAELFLNEISKDFLIFQIEEISREQEHNNWH